MKVCGSANFSPREDLPGKEDPRRDSDPDKNVMLRCLISLWFQQDSSSEIRVSMTARSMADLRLQFPRGV